MLNPRVNYSLHYLQAEVKPNRKPTTLMKSTLYTVSSTFETPVTFDPLSIKKL